MIASTTDGLGVGDVVDMVEAWPRARTIHAFNLNVGLGVVEIAGRSEKGAIDGAGEGQPAAKLN